MAIEPIKGFYVHDEETNTDGVAKVDYYSLDGTPEFNTPSYLERVDVTIINGKRYNINRNFDIQDAPGYYACSIENAEPNTEYIFYSRNIAGDLSHAVGFLDGTTVVKSIVKAGQYIHELVAVSPSACDTIRWTTNNMNDPPFRVYKKVYGQRDYVHVELSGYDTAGDGSAEYPFASIQKAIDSNFGNNVKVGIGRFRGPVSAENKENLSIIGDIAGGTFVEMSRTITCDNDSATGLWKSNNFTETADSTIYKCFVSKIVPLYDDSGNSRVYTVNLWDFGGSQRMVPKESLAEVQATPDSWFYDGANIYCNSSYQNYKLVDGNESVALAFNNIKKLHLANLTAYYSGSDNCRIYNCPDFNITQCSFLCSGTSMGLAIRNANGIVEKSIANQNGIDGFNIHEKGHTTFIDCYADKNRDDGMSHHNASTGTVIGGIYSNNIKGGISPTYDSKVDVYNAVCDGNGYGLYYSTSDAMQECIASNCILINNTGAGLRVKENYTVRSYGNLFGGNNVDQRATDNGFIEELPQ